MKQICEYSIPFLLLFSEVKTVRPLEARFFLMRLFCYEKNDKPVIRSWFD